MIGHSTIPMLDTRPPIDVIESEFVRLLGYPRHHELTGRARELADLAREWYGTNGFPWVYARRSETVDFNEEGFSIDGVSFLSERLREQLAETNAHAAMLVAVSAGPELEAHAQELWKAERPDEYFFMEVYGSAVVEHLITTAGARFCAEADDAGEAVLPHYSPGYPDWDVAEQTRLLRLIQSGPNALERAALDVFDTGMLKPKKSLLAVFGITRHLDTVQRLTDLVPCSRCPMGGCRYRRAGYSYTPGFMSETRKLRYRPLQTANGQARAGIVLDHNAAYSISTKALAKWSEDRLQVSVQADGTIDALFRFEGTTCSNLGHPLSFDYRITLDSPEHGYRILEASCTPAANDEGHKLMCKYQKDPEGLMRAIGTERPLLGKSIDEVLHWDRKFSPTGCYCDAAGRAHKWGMALEVLHYALVQREKRESENRIEERKSELQR